MTIKDIARLSGCGVATVSRVLNGHRDVSEETRRRVLAVVEEQGFEPNANAKNLKQQAGKSVAVLVKGSQNLLFADLVEQVQIRLGERGQETALYYLDEDRDEVAYARQLCRERKPQGLLFLGGDLECFRRGFGDIHTPAVLLTNGAGELEFPNLSSLTTDDRAAAHQVIAYLAGRGVGRNLARQSAYLKEHKAELSKEEKKAYNYEAAGQLLDREPGLTAIFALGDVIALGCIRALMDRGRRVPEDISVVGYDGVVLSRYSIPRLTTVRQDTAALAEQGVELLLGQIQGDQIQPIHRTVPFLLVEGESVARLKETP